MVWLCLAFLPLAFAISCPLTAVARAIGRRVRALDGPGVPGQVKAAHRRVPNTGGVAVFLGVAAPIALGLAVAPALREGGSGPLRDWLLSRVPSLPNRLPGLFEKTGPALALLGGLLVLHLMGLIDDRRPLRAGIKMLVMLVVAGSVVLLTDSRLLTLLDQRVPGGVWLSMGITVVWLVVVTNAFNFLDNMDGLSAGVAAIAGGFFLIATLVNGQWFVAGCLALLVGSLLGFLVFNFPWRGPATIFMGDGGSIVVGFLLGFLTVRTTYVGSGIEGPGLGSAWYGLFMPLVVLAIPLYDFCSVTLIRLSQGKSPFVGDLQHFSHRLVRRGLSKRAAVVVIYGFTAVTAIGGVSLARLEGWQAILVGVQTALVLTVLAIEEWSSSEREKQA
jgi:UDP-GlcNAc:undecaprenyl-phosphate/decaprenyl-phosphate GlcNAc-1-phosphate transferase